MNEIKRDLYLQKLIDRKENGSIKVITGIRRSGKSYLLFHIYYNYLIDSGIDSSQIIEIALDSDEFEDYRDRKALREYILSKTDNSKNYYIFLDEIQFCEGFESLLNGLSRHENFDIYVTGSNSKFLSTDILTEFRGRGDEVRVYPLSFQEFYSAVTFDKYEAWREYMMYGGLPQIVSRRTDEQKSKYLTDLFNNTYLRDVIERNHLQGDFVMETLVNVLASSIGSLTNPTKISHTFQSNGIHTNDKTISSYIHYLTDAFLINKAERYDVKGRKYIGSPIKYYYTDVGLRNARLNFRQQEPTHIMENIIYNELLVRGFNVDVGVVPVYIKNDEGQRKLVRYEIDFVCNKGNMRYYIQSAYSIFDSNKLNQETKSLDHLGDSFKKIILTNDNIKPWINDKGYHIINVIDFLLDNNFLN